MLPQIEFFLTVERFSMYNNLKIKNKLFFLRQYIYVIKKCLSRNTVKYFLVLKY